MQKYLSQKLKTTPNSGLSSDRHLYIGLEQAEPNLGYPGEKSSSIPLSENYYKLITIDGANLMDRYWVIESPAKLTNGLSIYDENVLVGTASSVSKLNFNGDFIEATASGGSISTITFGPPAGNNGKVVFVNGSGSFSLSDKLLFNPSAGILTVNNRFDVGIGGTIFTVKDYNVGINTTNPTARLHVNGNVRIDGILEAENIFSTGISTFATLSVTQLKDSNNSAGTLGQVLSSTGVGVSWANSSVSGNWTNNVAIRTDNVTYTNTTGSLLYVSATPGIDRDAEGLSSVQVAGSYSIAEVDGIEVARTRDNGTANTEFLFLNAKFFVPNGSNYIVKVYNTIGTQWISSITTYSWSEFKFGL